RRMDEIASDEGELMIDEREEEEDEGERSGVTEDIEEEEEERRVMEDIEEEDEEDVNVVDMNEEEKKDEEMDGMGEEEKKEQGGGIRMTLRPHTETKGCPSSSVPSSTEVSSSEVPTTSTTSSSMASGGGGLPSAASSSTTAMAGMHKRKHWSYVDMLMFYEAVKQYGKDFDALHRVISKRKIDTNKEQLRNFFFNFYRQVRNFAEIKEEDWPAEMSRDARDLFVVINGCEWRKRMNSCKIEPAKLKALIMEGSTVTRVKGRKIKTPCCPALLQFFSFNRRITRFPPDIVLYLSPRRYKDGTNVMSRGQNSHLCIRLNTCDRMERVFELLHHKWKGEDG
ncbi:hypothetical protein PMAYCL1PPCAC_11762, partial [Pristionchus mayeri]